MQSQKPMKAIPFHRNPKYRAVIFQLLTVALIVWFISYLSNNTIANMAQRGIVVGIDWIDKLAPFQVGFSPFLDNILGEATYWDIFFIAIQNTIFVSFFGIIGATILGFIIGVLRLSPNWLVAKLAAVYIEIFRNIPLLLWFFFWYVAVFLPIFPPIQESINFLDAFYINKEGFYIPRPLVAHQTGFIVYMLLIIGGIVGTTMLANKVKRKQELTGEQFPLARWVLGIMLAIIVIGYYITGAPVNWEFSEAGRFQMSGGININTSFFVCWFALTTYTAAFIAENVRGGILAVAHGQTEAATALGLPHGKVLRLVVIPQAMRVIIPPTISQYLNLTKNSTLAVAVAYEEVASLWMGISLNTTGQALIIIVMSVGVFWVLSFLTSALLNWYNKRVQLEER